MTHSLNRAILTWAMLYVATSAVVLGDASPSAAEFDLSPSSISPAEILSGGPGKDGIPALSSPRFEDADAAGYLRPNDRVVGISRGTDARAYPLRILNWHEIVNDTVGGQPIAVTYCPLTGSAVAFDRSVDGRTLEFGVSGRLYRSNVLMYDRQTESLWSQLAARAVTGAMNDTPLRQIPLEVTTWADWRSRHPATRVLSIDTGYRRDYGRDPYASYRRSPRTMFPLGPADDRLPAKDLVIGVRLGGAIKAYRVRGLPAAGLADNVGSRAIRIRFDPTTERAVATDAGTGRAVPAVVVYWFAWSAFYPETELWVGSGARVD